VFFSHLPPGYDVQLHPLAFAGWLGFFITALNLLPLGQLDGGHIAYVALGKWQRVFRIVALAAMLGLGFLWSGWFFWGVLVLILGLGHPPTLDEVSPLTRTDWVLIVAAILVFILTFIPNPFPGARV
jgi:membrane-associated protease RseP (regulator of RpoE activity)